MPAGQPAIVEMTGQSSQIEEVKSLISKVLQNGPQSISLLQPQFAGPPGQIITDSMEMPKEKVGITIGAKGVVIQEIMRRTGCKVVIDQPEGLPCKAQFSGTFPQIETAKAMIISVMNSGPSVLQMAPGGAIT